MKKIIYDILMAYEEHGIHPARGLWGNGTDKACGLGVLYYHHIGLHAGLPHGHNILTLMATKLGLSQEYVIGFVHGFDGYRYEQPSEAILEGLRDGRDAFTRANISPRIGRMGASR